MVNFSGQDLNQTPIIIKNDGFWPDMDLEEFQTERAMPPNFNPTLLRDAIVSAVVEINLSLDKHKNKLINQGFTKADDVGVISVEGVSSTVIIYKKAVFARVKADLLGEFVSVSSRDQNLGENQKEMKNALLAESTREIRKLLGLKRCGVSLI